MTGYCARFVLAASLLTIPMARSSGQEIVIDWSTDTVACPASIDYPTRVNYVVRELNDMLFAYEIQAILRPRSTNDWAQLRGGGPEAATKKETGISILAIPTC